MYIISCVEKVFFIVNLIVSRNPVLSVSTNQWLCSLSANQGPTPQSFTPPASLQLATISTHLSLCTVMENTIHCLRLHLLWCDCCTCCCNEDVNINVIQPYKEVIQFSKVLIFLIFLLFVHHSNANFCVAGQSWQPWRERSSWEACKCYLPCCYFSVEFLHQGFNYPLYICKKHHSDCSRLHRLVKCLYILF